MKIKFYLSGGMENKKALGGLWRDNMTEKLAVLGYGVFNPIELERSNPEVKNYDWKKNKQAKDLEPVRHMVRQHLFIKDMLGVQKSQATVLLYDESVQRGAGSLAEAWETFREGKPLYVISLMGREHTPVWLIGESCEVFHSVADFLVYVSNVDRVKADMRNAKKIRDQYLGEIY